ncbi:hypothetical protein [Carnobacterium inhibens]|uniref:hypothetical protein n=1 Tax=Carnobacterium inhibens TaxID=147709 RepID=UPI002041888D|nr:hypothetical protein [Carnobacterium inhibens]MCM3512251.1 hypothetical protein [Carnobacterium inhibens]
MKSWKVVLWLFAFYPIGIYNMFKYTNWNKGIKYTITAVLGLITWLMFSSGQLPFLLIFSGFIVFLVGLVSVATNWIKKKDKRASVGVLFIGILLLTYSVPRVEEQQQQEQQEQIEKQVKEEQIALVKEATIAVETTEKDKNRANYEKATELVGSLKPKNQDLADRLTAIDTHLTKEEKIEEATLAIEKAETDKTKENYEAAASLMSIIDTEGTDLEGRLAKVKGFVDTETEKTEKAVAALEEAEKSKKRESYNKANGLISELTAPDEKLTARLKEADTVIAAEEEKVAAEKAEQVKITAKKAEDAKLASEKEEQANSVAAKTEDTVVPETEEQVTTGGDVSSIDTNGNGNVTIPEAKAAGFSMPITSDHWLYPYMDDRDNDGMVGE